ncbi:cytidylate kinase-like family protein [Flammeovirga kamogawensis]|uniref:Cytidylate kinase-like family protein n=1 Tax=Flammeovirga kamogawensis TaxID=373891 RepID=A0ABX8H1N2_9BACT|nr:cytidylate kinase family protein [Flammeovirga kamogawensis]MBB6463578.1 cytidylate kinase [Flammeovirga kamogawensis]QWG09804.1 cytidylate kinase-like family protein [Flammeovirga kamogawensis]TRX65312.1 cytidylate kinase-like family protein [Flammeovirga kamogawensis]
METYIYNYLASSNLEEIKTPKSKGLIFTLSRDFGTNIKNCAVDLVEKLNNERVGFSICKKKWALIDSVILSNISKELKIGYDALNQFVPIEHKSIFDQILHGLDFNRSQLDDNLHKAIQTVIYSYFERGNVVFLGRGAAYFTNQLDNAVNFKIKSSYENRIHRYGEKNKVNYHYAKEIVRRKAKRRNDFLSYISKGKHQSYDFVLNRDIMDDDTLTSLLFDLCKNKEIQYKTFKDVQHSK